MVLVSHRDIDTHIDNHKIKFSVLSAYALTALTHILCTKECGIPI